MNLSSRIANLRREAELLSHPLVQGLAETFQREPQVRLGSKPQVRFLMPSWLSSDQVSFTYEELLDMPETIAGPDGLSATFETHMGEAHGVPVSLVATLSIDYPPSVLSLLFDMGKMTRQVNEPYAYNSLQCS